MPIIHSINTALPERVTFASGEELQTAIRKRPVTGRVFLDTLGFEGDGSADRYHHGGSDKAVCVYSREHFPFWERKLSRTLSCGAFGENLTVTDLTEADVHIGDIFRIGEAEVQCTQPRQPCHKLIKAFDWNEMAHQVLAQGFCGYYLRVIKPGWVQPGDSIDRLTTDPDKISVLEAHQLMHKGRDNVTRIRELVAVAALSESWREYFQKVL